MNTEYTSSGNNVKQTRWLQMALWGTAALLAVLAVRMRLQAEVKPPDALHGDAETSSAALDAKLSQMPQNKQLPFLLKSLQENSPGLRYSAVDALGNYPSPATADVLEHAYQDSSSIVRERAMERLLQVDRDRGLHLLLAGLRDEDSWIRDAAINQFASSIKRAVPPRSLVIPTTGGFGRKPSPVLTHASTPAPVHPPIADRRIVPMLMRILDDPDTYIPLRAVLLLHDITGRGRIYKTKDGAEEKREVIAEWKAWWAKAGKDWQVPADLMDVPPIRPARADAAPALDLRDVNGRGFHLGQQRGRVTLLNFWGTWCPPCRVETPDLERLHLAYSSQGLDILGVAVGEQNDESLRKWCLEHSLTYCQARSTAEAQMNFGSIEEVPVSILVDKKGFIRYRWDGERDFATFQAAVERLLKE